MATLAFYADIEAVCACHDRPLDNSHGANRKTRPIVHAENHIHGKAGEEPFLDHELAAAFMLLGRLKDQVDRAVESPLFPQQDQRFGGTEQGRDMAVMAAGMHAARKLRAMGKGIALFDGQGIHIGAQANAARTAARAQTANDAGSSQANVRFDPQLPQTAGDQL